MQSPFKEKFQEIETQFFNVRSDLQGLPLENIVEEQKRNVLPFSVCALNLSGELNIGTMIRTAVIFGAEKFYIFGRRKFDRRSLVGSNNYIEIEAVDGFKPNSMEIDPAKFINFMEYNKFEPYFVEQRDSYFTYEPEDVPIRKHHNKNLIVFGSENSGIPDEIFRYYEYNLIPHSIITIPQYGVMRSLNVGVACGIVLYNIARKLKHGTR